MITIDNRELGLINLCSENKITINTSQLEVGDIQIDGQEKHILIERKTFKDLSASIKDKRYHDQLFRMIELKNNFEKKGIKLIIVYVLESPDYTIISENVLTGITSSLIIKYGIFYEITQSLTKTLALILRYSKKININVDPKKEITKLSLIGGKKVDKINPERYNLSLFKEIPTIGEKKAEILFNKYETIFNLSQKITIFPDIVNELKALKMTNTNIDNIIKFLSEKKSNSQDTEIIKSLPEKKIKKNIKKKEIISNITIPEKKSVVIERIISEKKKNKANI